MKQIVALLALVIAFSASAQGRGKKLNEQERQRFRTEMRAYKHRFIAQELKLSEEQQRDFFVVYDEMEDAVERIGNETRELERSVANKTDASDVELESAARASFGQKKAEGEMELQYFDRLKQILTPQQLLRLRHVERKFTRKLMRHHNDAAKRSEAR